MHVFVTGGSGLTGPTVVAELVAAGHTVTGLARSDAAAARLESLGAAPHRGSLDDLDSLRSGVHGLDVPVSSFFTQETLGWSPTHPTLDDLVHGDYFATPAS